VIVPGLQQVAFAAPATATTDPPPTTTPPPTTVAPTTTPTTARPAVTPTTAAGRCASTSLPFGTVLTIRDNATGTTITCVVDDRETAGPPHLVDLSPEGFSEMAPLSQGVIGVTVTW
jgi:hypothetical protein